MKIDGESLYTKEQRKKEEKMTPSHKKILLNSVDIQK
jgi:hypothetical protein